MSRIMSLPELLKLKGISLLEKLNSYVYVPNNGIKINQTKTHRTKEVE